MSSNQWDDAREALVQNQKKVVTTVKSAWSGFLNFAARDNVLEVAVGLVLGAAFTAVVTSLVSDIILPPLSLLPFLGHNMNEKFLILKHGHQNQHYLTVQQALDDGAVVWAWGQFLTSIFRFFGIGFALYAIANIYGYVSKDSIIKKTVRCAYCRKEISQKAKRCYLCTSWLDGREEKDAAGLPPRT